MNLAGRTSSLDGLENAIEKLSRGNLSLGDEVGDGEADVVGRDVELEDQLHSTELQFAAALEGQNRRRERASLTFEMR